MAYIQKNNPFPVTSCGRRRTFTQGGNPGNDRTKKSPFGCWEGYKRKPGTKEFSKGSCIKESPTKMRKTTKGKLIVKEYPTASANVNHFRALLNELNLKRSFVPDIIFVDYLNICTSSRIKTGANVNSYTYIKSIAEELRGLAVENKIPIVSATQTTRSGYSNTDVGLEDTSESFGLPATADLMFAIISTEQMEELGQIMVKQLKNRYNDPTVNRKFVVGIDRAKMRLFDVDASEQTDIVNSGQVEDVVVFDKTEFNNKYDDFKV